jgi:hypothetical protein
MLGHAMNITVTLRTKQGFRPPNIPSTVVFMAGWAESCLFRGVL